ncbi:tRNA (adenine(9)-N1)-methyltransferase Trm10 [Sulfurisphaera javensis]|uniref:tRNA (Adenine(9)-N1)-methyltransferase Trm10 n=1 Tax=Sulfurisphaera javensis TaxID=2049879 RepID=A0AAT9GSY7_9CREN
MILGKIFAEELKKKGIDKLYVGYEEPSLQKLAVKMLLKNYGILRRDKEGIKVKEEEGVSLYKGKGGEKVEYVFVKGGEKITFNPPKYPLIVIDLGLFDELDEEEKRKTLLQIDVTLSVIRKYLWDRNLAIAHYNYSVGKSIIINSLDSDNCIILDPYGDIIANEEIIRKTDIIIIGGIVDKGRRLKYATKRLAEMYNYPCKRVKIALRGSTVGVPDEINKIVDIILKVKTGKELEKAIIEDQSKGDKLARALMDINNHGVEILNEEVKWLNIDDKLYKIILRKIKNTNSVTNH